MTNERATKRDVRWLDEAGLHRAVVGGDQEAFAELMWRYDPLVRSQLKRCASDEKLDVAIADFWCAMIAMRIGSAVAAHVGHGARRHARAVADGARCVRGQRQTAPDEEGGV